MSVALCEGEQSTIYLSLFQNRYKSIVCDEDDYFKELVRYIHLNPLRAKLVRDLTQLDRYRWSGHGVLMGVITNDWQDSDYVLKYFGKSFIGRSRQAGWGNHLGYIKNPKTSRSISQLKQHTLLSVNAARKSKYKQYF